MRLLLCAKCVSLTFRYFSIQRVLFSILTFNKQLFLFVSTRC